MSVGGSPWHLRRGQGPNVERGAMNRSKRSDTVRRGEVVYCALLCFVTASLSFAYFIYKGSGFLTIRADFDAQQIPFTIALHEIVRAGGLANWCWNLDLGTSVIQGFGFYELGSPFFWATMVFPSSWFPYVVGWMYVVKYVVAGITSFLFLRRFTGSYGATAGALLYAFSGFQTTNLLFYHFHDVVALFPTMLIGLERLMEDGDDWAPFVLATCINAFTNYFFLVQDVVFLVLYFVVRFGPDLMCHGIGGFVRALARCLVCGALGCGMAAALLAPSILYMMSNSRASGDMNGPGRILVDYPQLLRVLLGMLLPGDAMSAHNAVTETNYLSVACWLPMVGPSLSLAYVKTRRDWISTILALLFLASFSPLLSSAFLLFRAYYCRWWYFMVLMGALASALVIDSPDEYEVGFGTIIAAAAITGLSVAVCLLPLSDGASALLHPMRFSLYVFIALSGLLATLMLTRAKRPRRSARLYVLLMLFCVISTGITLHFYRVGSDGASTRELVSLGTELSSYDEQYRYATGDNRLTLTGEAIGTSSFSSTVSTGIAELDLFFGGNDRAVRRLDKQSVPGLSELLGGRYSIVREVDGDDKVLDSYEVLGTTYYIVDGAACPIGFTLDKFILADEVAELERDQRAIALMQAVAVDERELGSLDDYAERVSITGLDLSTPISNLVRHAEEAKVSAFERDARGLSFSVDAEGPCVVYLSVPFDSGWSATVDGEETALVDSAGMTALPIGGGRHEVKMVYVTPGVRVGMAVSVMSWAILILLLFKTFQRKADA